MVVIRFTTKAFKIYNRLSKISLQPVLKEVLWDGWIDGGRAGRMDGLMPACVRPCVRAWMKGGRDGRNVETSTVPADKCLCGWVDGKKDRRTDEETNDGQANERRIVRSMEAQTFVL